MNTTIGESTQTLCKRCSVILLHDDGPCAACSDEPQQWSELDCIGPYRVRRALGAGPTGRTFLCDDDAGTERLVVKLLRWHADPATAERCVRESRMIGRITHHSLIAIRAIGRARGEPFVASEWVDGPSIERLMARRQPRSPNEALLIVRSVALALEAAQTNGHFHHSIKPTNLFVSTTGDVKVGDFGHCVTRGGSSYADMIDTDSTAQAYEPPERLLGLAADHRGDIFSLGIVLHQLLTGTAPSSARTGVSLNQDEEPLVPGLLSVRPELHAALVPLVEKMTAIELGHRHQSYTELIAHVDDVQQSLRVADRMRFGLDDDESDDEDTLPGVNLDGIEFLDPASTGSQDEQTPEAIAAAS